MLSPGNVSTVQLTRACGTDQSPPQVLSPTLSPDFGPASSTNIDTGMYRRTRLDLIGRMAFWGLERLLTHLQGLLGRETAPNTM
jgi:hypothetical protein